jgi:hypothetical protein
MKFIVAAVALATLTVSEASAAVMLRFDVSTEAGARFRFLLPENPVPDQVIDFGGNSGLFRLIGINARNAANDPQVIRVAFGNTFGVVNFSIVDFDNLDIVFVRFGKLGQQTLPILFTGTLSDPTFKRGSFDFTASTDRGQIFDGGTVQIAAVPEPATWLSLIAGFGLAGAALRYRRRNSCTLTVEGSTITR